MRFTPATLLIAILVPLLSGCGRNLAEMATNTGSLGCIGLIVLILDVIALIEVFGSSRTLGGKVLWGLLIFFLPLVGVLAYFLFGRDK